MSEAQEDKLKDVARHSMALISCSVANDLERLRSKYIQSLPPCIAVHARFNLHGARGTAS
jgi:hypothetical protein